MTDLEVLHLIEEKTGYKFQLLGSLDDLQKERIITLSWIYTISSDNHVNGLGICIDFFGDKLSIKQKGYLEEVIKQIFYECSDNLCGLEILSLSGMDIAAFIPWVCCKNSLKSLYLSCDGITLLPEGLSNLTSLVSLDLSRNKLCTLPDGMSNLTSLASLDLSHNQLSTFPDNLSNLTLLTSLNLSDNQLSTLPDSLSNLTLLTSLNLSGNQLSTLPDSLSNLTLLTSLDLDRNQLSSLPENLSNLTLLTSLDLSGNQLSTLPENLSNLTLLTSLDLSVNQLSSLPENLSNLTSLTSLDLDRNQLSSLPDSLGKLTSLTSLYLSNNTMRTLPDSLSNLSSLISLNLSDNQLSTLPDSLSNLSSLISLNLSDNQLSTLPDSLSNLSSLTSLNLSNNQLSTLPDSLSNLSSLTSLNLFDNQLSTLPDSLSNLTLLKSLNLSDNQLSTLPDSLSNLTLLKSLNLSDNQLSTLPDSLSNLSSLTSLYLSKNQLSALPGIILSFKKLKSLDVSNNEIKSIPDAICKLTTLVTLNLSNNRNLTSLPDCFQSMNALKTVNLSKLSLDCMPVSLVRVGLPIFMKGDEVAYFLMDQGILLWNTVFIRMDGSLFEQPFPVICNFYKDGLVRLQESKVIFLGDGGAGKSCLIDRIVYNRYNPDSLPTDGIAMERWTTDINGEPVTLRIMDFGGQEIMHAMHRCFLTSRTVYVIVLDSRQDNRNDETARYWLDTVLSVAPDCRIIVAMSKNDLCPTASLNEYNLMKRYPNIVAIRKVSAEKNIHIDDLKNDIKSAVRGSAGYQYYFNQRWVTVKAALENLPSDYIKDDQYDDICQSAGVTDAYLKMAILEWFKDLGISYFYSSDDFAPTPERFRVLKPEWLTNGIYTLINKATPDRGILAHSAIRYMLNSGTDAKRIRYSAEEVEFIMYVMRKFGISHNVGEGEFIPLTLSKNPPASVKTFPLDDALHISWQSDYIPQILVNRLMVRLFIPDLDQTCMWRTGARFDDTLSSCAALVTSERQVLDIYIISTRTEDRRIYLEKIRAILIPLMNELNLNLQEMLHYTVHNKAGKKSYQAIINQIIRKPQTEIYLEDIDEYVAPGTLIAQYFTRDHIEREIAMNSKSSAGEGKQYVFNKDVVFNGPAILGDNEGNQNVLNYNDAAKRINEQPEPSANTVQQILAELNAIVISGDLKRKDEDALRQIVDHTQHAQKASRWSKLREFLSDSANIATIYDVASRVAPVLMALLVNKP